MRSVVSLLAIVLLNACGARSDDGHTGGKTSWLSICGSDGDCSELQGSVCVNQMCTQSCDANCGLPDTTCTSVVTQRANDEQSAQVCLPVCVNNRDCSNFGSGYACESGVCLFSGNNLSVRIASLDAGAVSNDYDALATPNGADTTASNYDAHALTHEGDAFVATNDTVVTTTSSDAGTFTTDEAMSIAPEETDERLDSGSIPDNTDTGIPDMVPNPHDCPETIDLPGERPHLEAIQALGFDNLPSEPACDGLCGYRHYDTGIWTFDWTLTCPLLDATTCDGLSVQLAEYVPVCNTLYDCNSYSGATERCFAYFDEGEYWTTELFTEQQLDSRDALRQQFREGGCGTPRAATGLTYMPVDCVAGVCTFESSPPCE